MASKNIGLQHLINHIALVVDRSGSMQDQPVVQVFDKELAYLQQRSIELNQETRISIYLFDEDIECLTFDMDVMRFKTLAGHWSTRGMTAMLDAVEQSVKDHQQLPELYGDHAFLTYVITDGQENASQKTTPQKLKAMLASLPEHWTTACLVPDVRGKHEAKKFGFDDDAIAIWDTSAPNAFETVGQKFRSGVDQYMQQRAKGVRGTKSFFATLDTSKLKTQDLDEIAPRKYSVHEVKYEGPIKEYVEDNFGVTYKLGMAFYQPTKPVKVQDHKDILVQNVISGKMYSGSNIRQLLGLPDSTVTVEPGAHTAWRVFVQSTSTNRKLFAGQHIVLWKDAA
jgi:hypothetical protein